MLVQRFSLSIRAGEALTLPNGSRVTASTLPCRPAQIPIIYGLVHPIGSYNPLEIALHEWGAMAADVKRARSWRERLRQLFGRPAGSLANTLLLVEETRA